jgi:ribosome biogenesis protein BMS1
MGADEKMEKSTLRIFKGSKAAVAGSESSSSSSDDDSNNHSSDDDSGDEEDENEANDHEDRSNLPRRRRPFNDNELQNKSESMGMDDDGHTKSDGDDRSSSSDDETSNDGSNSDKNDSLDGEMENNGGSKGAGWKLDIAERARQSFFVREVSTINPQEMNYGSSNHNLVSDGEDYNKLDDENDHDSMDDDEFFKPKNAATKSVANIRGAAVESLQLSSMLLE